MRKLERGFAGFDSLAVHAGVDAGGDLQLRFGCVGGLLHPIHHHWIIHYEHERGIFFRERYRARNVIGAGRLFGPQHVLDARAGHQFRLRDSGAGETDRSLADLISRHIHTLVNLDVRTNVDAVALGGGSHGAHIPLEHCQIHHHARRRQNVFCHAAEITAGDARFKFGVWIGGVSGFTPGPGRQASGSGGGQKLSA